MFDASQARMDPAWWSTRSKKAPVGPGMSSAYQGLVKSLEEYKKDMGSDTAKVVVSNLESLRGIYEGLPLVKSKIKPNEYFRTALMNCWKMARSAALGKGIMNRYEKNTKKDLQDTAAGKGNDGATKAGSAAEIAAYQKKRFGK